MPIQNPRAHIGSSKFLKFADIANKRVTVTIQDSAEETMENGGEVKGVLYFVGKEKGLVLNSGNTQLLCDMLGDDAAAWNGRQIVLWGDPSVMYAGKRTGGIKIEIPNGHAAPVPARGPVRQAQPAPAPAAAQWTDENGAAAVDDENIPF